MMMVKLRILDLTLPKLVRSSIIMRSMTAAESEKNMKFAEKYFDEIKSGTILIFIDNSDDEFTKGTEYLVKEDEKGLYVVDDGQFDQLFNKVLAKYFVIKEPDKAEIQTQLKQAEADNAALVKEFEKLLSYDSLQWLHDHFRDIILISHPGTALLKELEQLRRENEKLKFTANSCTTQKDMLS